MISFGLVITAIWSQAQELPLASIPPKDSLIKYIGTRQNVIGKIYGGKYLDKHQLTLLYLGASNRNQVLTIVIKGDDRNKFRQAPEVLFKDKVVVVKGITSTYEGKLQIVVSDTSQIAITGKVRRNY
ncbi:hypothetical protein LX99_04050 [Mucilaginibacter oryzae]|uniref:Uncharacterized protein n=2 Tax=Mucilaginibacter oryzae TaxID=468058 RepID=A0A316HA21_9SPHI|nr:hypothetical protein LX99_04050 [Mucilaginibacter oryzae]